jgi:putative ATPase
MSDLFQSATAQPPFSQSNSRGPNTFEGRADQFWAEVTGQEQPRHPKER